MSGNNNGTGVPMWFRCSSCRGKGYARLSGPIYGSASRVTLTGRTRKAKPSSDRRNDSLSREYRCGDCRHTGWSRHVELRALAAQGGGK